MPRLHLRIGLSLLCLPLFLLSAGCTHKLAPERVAAMSDGDGAIDGKLVGGGGDRFDLSLGGADPLQIQLMNPDHGVVDSTTPVQGKPRFIFDHVKPGTYELSVYRDVRGKRTIAGSEPVTVDAGQITPATLTLQVTEVGGRDEAVTR